MKNIRLTIMILALIPTLSQAKPFDCNNSALIMYNGIATSLNKLTGKKTYTVKNFVLESEVDELYQYRATIANRDDSESLDYFVYLSSSNYARCLPIKLELVR